MARTILIVDDLNTNCRILSEMLKDSYDILQAGSGEEALRLLAERGDAISAVLLDVVMPGMDGFAVLRRIRADKQFSSMPVIMVTSSDDEDVRVRALAAGANDFVMKPYKSSVITHCLKNNIALREASVAASAAQRDGLTGLYNREAFFEKVGELTAQRAPGYYIMACFDIDKFKVVNDQYGTEKGDDVLRHTADTFRRGFTANGGLCGRIGADKFAVLYPAAFADTPELARIREQAAHVEGLISPIIFSIGRYIVADPTMSPSAMYDRAALAAKAIKGRYDVKIALYDETMRERLIREQELVQQMQSALKARQFEVWYQPQYNHATHAMIGAEALVRWRHPDKGLIPPDDFIPAFEENGFIYALDRFVWEEVCAFLRKCLDAGRAPLPVSVNISRYDIFCPDMPEVLAGLLETYRLPVELLRLEITESAFSESTEHIVEVVKALIAQGFTVEIDDFGSGYSSLNTLKDVPAQIIKLDMRFLESSNSERGGNIVESVVRMAKWLGMSVIAEGVETLVQADYLLSIGCCYMQGYFYAKPMPVQLYEAHCDGTHKEERLLTLETVENLNNNTFWDPASMDTLIFNSYVGAACIFEYGSTIEVLRANRKFVSIFGEGVMSVEDTLRLNWLSHLTPESRTLVRGVLRRSGENNEEYTGEYVFEGISGCPPRIFLRATMRVIARSGERLLVYCTCENITAQREAEQKERRLAIQFQTIMDNVDLGIVASVFENGVLRFLFANDKFYEMRGYTREQYHSEIADPHSILPAGLGQGVKDKTLDISRTGDSAVMEYEVTRRDGSKRIFRNAISIGTFPGIDKPVQLSIFRDVTEEKQAEQRERRTAEQMQVIMDDIGSGVTASVNRNGNVELLFSNEKYFSMRGYTRAQYQAEVRDYYERVLPEDAEQLRRNAAAAYTSPTPIESEYRMICRDGSLRYFLSTMSGTRFTGVAENVLLSIYTDITEQKQAAQQIQATSAQLQSMMDDMPGGFCRMRLLADGRIVPVYINNGLCKLAGMTQDEMMALYAKDAMAGVHPEDIPIVEDAVARMLKHGEARSARYRLLHRGGGYVWLSIFGRVTKELAGETLLNIYYTDATEQMKQETQQRELLDNLPYGAGLYDYDDREKSFSIVHLNRRYWELMERDPAKYADYTLMDIIHPDDRAMLLREVADAIRQGRDAVCDHRVLCANNEYRPFRMAARIVPKGEDKYALYMVYTPISEEAMSIQEMLPIALGAMMNSRTDLSFVKDRNLRYICCSRSVAELAGRASEAEMLGKTDYELLDKSLADAFSQSDRRILQSGEPVLDRVDRLPSPDGTDRYACTSKFPLKDAKGNVVGVYGVGQDITESRALRSQFQLLTESIPGGMAAYEYSGGVFRMTRFNDGLCALFGVTREELAERGGQDVFAGIHEEDRAKLREQLDALLRCDTPVDCIYRVRVQNGTYRWIDLRSSGLERSGDRATFNAVFFDITQRQEAAERIRISEEEYRLALQLSGTVVGRYTVATRTLTMSAEGAAHSGLSAVIEDVPYGPVRLGVIAPKSEKAYVEFFEGILQGKPSGTTVFYTKLKDGWGWQEAHYCAIFSSEHEPVSAIISFVDVTEQLEKEMVYKKWTQSMEDKDPGSYMLFRCNLNNETDYVTTEGTLLTFDFKGAGLNFNDRARDYAALCVCPEDRECYAAMANSDTLLANYYRGKRSYTLEYRELLPDEAMRWLRLTIDLVEIPSSGEVEAYLLYEDIDAAKKDELQTRLLAETDPLTGVYNRTYFAAQVEHILKISPAGARHALLMLDLDGFKRVNDVFGHGAGDKALVDIAAALRTVVRRDDLIARLGGDEFLVFLKGIPDDNAAAIAAKRVCELTQKAFSMEVEISGSVGIAIAPQDGADFETLYKNADSALYYVKGSGKNNYVFYGPDMADEHLAPEPDGEPGKKPVKRRRMLIVDDNRMDHAFLQNIFRDEFIIEKAKDGNTALIRLRHYGGAISVVLLDLMMEGMDGFAVLEKMQSSAELRGIPVLIVSGDESRETCLKAIRKGATDFVTKPVDAEILRVRVHSAVSKAENERLRARNRLFEVQNEERERFEAAIESAGIAYIECDWLTGEFFYHPSVPKYIAGNYDGRKLWHILLSDMVANTQTVQHMQQYMHSVAEDRAQKGGAIVVKLKTPDKATHSFRMSIRKVTDDFRLTTKLIIALVDLDYTEE